VDEYLVYLAPALIGGTRVATTDVGVGTIADARRLRIRSVERIGEDVLIIARPDSGRQNGGAQGLPGAQEEK
jgi:diaminohydroxyphosphoribosylaminopyrimidine deaminase/5-amino-6-(5-phosphoribosylamino)uracil reductase